MKSMIFLMLALLSGCKNAENTGSSPQQTMVAFEVLHTDAISNIPDPLEEIISSEERLQEVFVHINSSRIPAMDVPDIDFSKESLIFVNLGYKSSGGYSVRVDRIEKDAEGYTVFLSGVSPGPGDMVATVITYPWTLVKMEKPEKEVVFRKSNQ